MVAYHRVREPLYRRIIQYVQVTLRRVAFGSDSAALDYRWEDTKIETAERHIADDAVSVESSGGLISR